jgi:RimJ/RimL family protein N-acetyltransferase
MSPPLIPSLETERLVLRPATAADLQAWSDLIFADPEVIRYMPRREMTPYARAERALNNYNRLWEAHRIGGWATTDKATGQLIGSCEIEYLDETDEYELGYAFGKAFWGKGLATETARAAIRYGFDVVGLEQVMAVVVPENNASWRVLEHIGFVYEKKANYYDLEVVYYSITPNQFIPGDSLFRVNGADS